MRSVKWLSVSVLEGYISSAGAGSESVIRSTRAALVKHTEKLLTADVNQVWYDMTTIMRTHISEDRSIIPALSVVAFLLDGAVFDQLDSETFR